MSFRNSLKYLVVLCLNTVIAYSQNTESIFSSLKKLKNKDLSDTARISIYLTLASEYVSYRNDSSFYYIEAAEEIIKKGLHTSASADAKYLRSIVYYTTSDFDKAQWSLNQTIT